MLPSRAIGIIGHDRISQVKNWIR